jgi:integrase
MGKRNIPGLQCRGGIWQIDKRVRGYGRLCESTGESSKVAAEIYLVRRLEDIRNAVFLGIHRVPTFREGATRYLTEYAHLPSIVDAAFHLELLDKWIGNLPMDVICDEVLTAFKVFRKKEGRKSKTINLSLGYVRRVVNLAARKWRDPITNKPWISTVPLIEFGPLDDQRPPKPITWKQQRILLPLLPSRNAAMALFNLNTGVRDSVVCNLRWEWERGHKNLPYSVFMVPKQYVKGRKSERVLVLNRVSQSIIDAQRGKHPAIVFPYSRRSKGKVGPEDMHPIETMNNSAWQKARKQAAKTDPQLWDLHVHDLRHTVGERLRGAAVSKEDRADILWHSSGSMTTHYSLARVSNLMKALDLIASEPEGPEVPLSELMVING